MSQGLILYISQLINRKQLLDIVRCHLPLSNHLQTVLRLQHIISEVEQLKAQYRSVYSYSKKKIVTKEKIGGRWVRQGKQYRWKDLTIPKRSRGRPSEAWRRVLICFLGLEFYRCTGSLPTRGSTNGLPSAFQSFVAQFLSAFKIQDQEGLVREYIKERRK